MRVLEIAAIPIVAGGIAEYIRVMEGATSYFTSHAGCRGVQVLQGVESPTTFKLIAEWDSVQAHMDFRETADFAAYRAAVAHLMARTPTYEHWQPKLTRLSGETTPLEHH